MCSSSPLSGSSYLLSPTPSASSQGTQRKKEKDQPSTTVNRIKRKDVNMSEKDEASPVPSYSATAKKCVQSSKEHKSSQRSDIDPGVVIIDEDDDDGYAKAIKLEGAKANSNTEKRALQHHSGWQPKPRPLFKSKAIAQAHHPLPSPPPPIATITPERDTDNESVSAPAFYTRSILNGTGSRKTKPKPSLRFPSNSQTSATKVGSSQRTQVIDLSCTSHPHVLQL